MKLGLAFLDIRTLEIFLDNKIKTMKLEIKHLAAYLPYSVKVSPIHVLHHGKGIGSIGHILTTNSKLYKLRLRPLSDLTIFYDEICWTLFDSRNPNNYESSKFEVDQVIKEGVAFDTYNGFVNWMYENHFDVFGLIKHDLAININTLNK